jgi:transposase
MNRIGEPTSGLEPLTCSLRVSRARHCAIEILPLTILAPQLQQHQLYLGAHKGKRVCELVEARSCELLFLPAYSPDFSPIEEAFSKLKVLLRRERARTKEALVEAMGWGLDAVSEWYARGFFAHCGYPIQAQLP